MKQAKEELLQNMIEDDKELQDEINQLTKKGLTIDNKKEFFLSKKEFGNNTVIDNYKHFFIHTWDKTKQNFIYGSNFSSLLELLKFDKKMVSLIIEEISIIETVFSKVMFNCINKNIGKELKNMFEIECYNFLENHSINYCLKNLEVQEVIIKIFKKHKAKRKKLLYKFLNYLIGNYDYLKKMSINQIFEKYQNINQNIDIKIGKLKMFFKNFFHITNLDLQLEQQNSNKLNELLKDKNNWYTKFINYFEDYCFYDFVNLFLYNLNDDYKKIDEYKSSTISTIFTNLSFGTYIKIFDGLKSNIKIEIIDELFELKIIDWKQESNKIQLFTDIMWMFRNLRNKCCHKKPIYNFEHNSYANEKVLDFLISNIKESDKKNLSPTKFNLFSAVCCIHIFRTFMKKNWNFIDTRVKNFLVKYKYFRKEIIPEKVQQKFKDLGIKLFR